MDLSKKSGLGMSQSLELLGNNNYRATSQPLSLSAAQPLSRSAAQPLRRSTALPLYLSTSLPLYLSTSRSLHRSIALTPSGIRFRTKLYK